MIVELVGLPGSGKSTYAKTLASEGKWKIIKIRGRAELLGYNLLFLLRHPIYFLTGLYTFFLYCGAPTLWWTKFTNLFLVHNAKYMKASSERYAIIDQGHFQNVLSLFDTTQELERIRAYVARLPTPDLLCFFVVDKEVREERMRTRGVSPRTSMDALLRDEWMQAGEAHFEELFIMREGLLCTTKVIASEAEAQTFVPSPSIRFVMHLRLPTEKAHGVQIAQTLRALQGEGASVELWIPYRMNRITKDFFAYYSLDRVFPVRTFHYPEALRLVSILGPIAYWFDSLFFLVALLCARFDPLARYYTRSPEVAWLLAQKGLRVWYEAHLWPASKDSLLCYLLRDVSGIVANSGGTKTMFEKNGFTNVTIVRNGADLAKFAIREEQHQLREEFDLPLEGAIVMYVGAFYAWKGVGVLLDAWNLRGKGAYPATLVLVGGERQELYTLGKKEIIQGREDIVVLSHQSAAAVPRLLAAADILVLPNAPVSEESVRYTSPIKLFEYMASGSPIVASDLPSIREVLSEETAVFAEAGNPKSLERAIARLLEDTMLQSRIGKTARQEVGQYDWSMRAKKLLTVLD